MDGARRTLLIVTASLLAVGVVMVYSASFVLAEKSRENATFFLERHAIYLVLGCIALAVTSLCDYHRVARNWKWFIAAAVVLLAAVLVPGFSARINGARRWFSIAGMTFQPTEAVKPLMIMGLAGWIVSSREKVGTLLRGFLPAVLLVCGVAALIAVEPDMGSACLI